MNKTKLFSVKYCLDLWLALRVGLWLIWLPVRLRLNGLEDLLNRLSPVEGRFSKRDDVDVDRVVRVAWRVSGLRLFNLQVFPRICLRRSLALYWILRKLVQPVEIHIGVHMEGANLQAHSWVSIDGIPIVDRINLDVLRVIYSYPTVSSNYFVDQNTLVAR